jgi:hypothetical protein
MRIVKDVCEWGRVPMVLEIKCTGNRTGGSNPSLSAKLIYLPATFRM